MLLKVCGMTQSFQIGELDAMRTADMIGFIFYAGSQRFMQEPPVEVINAKKVGVFVNATYDEIMHKLYEYSLDYVQLHANEAPELCRSLRAHAKVIKAFRVKDKLDQNLLKSYENDCDLFLFDTDTESYGGSGEKFDWHVLSEYSNKVPFILSGGIQPESVDAIVRLEHPQLVGVDINSRFETAPGIKNIRLIENFKKQLAHESSILTR
jgi:phosphoribosylanthranilate isomerase